MTSQYRRFAWPENKPIQEIVFPQLIDAATGSVVSLWLMLPEHEIKNRYHTNA
jgi:serine/threonine-protein kinase